MSNLFNYLKSKLSREPSQQAARRASHRTQSVGRKTQAIARQTTQRLPSNETQLGGGPTEIGDRQMPSELPRASRETQLAGGDTQFADGETRAIASEPTLANRKTQLHPKTNTPLAGGDTQIIAEESRETHVAGSAIATDSVPKEVSSIAQSAPDAPRVESEPLPSHSETTTTLAREFLDIYSAPLHGDRPTPFPRTAPDRRLLSLQFATAEAIFAPLGIAHFPHRLSSLLEECDAFRAAGTFLHALHFDYEDLLRYPQQQDLCREICRLLVKGDRALERAPLDDLPLYPIAQARDLSVLADAIVNLERAADLYAATVDTDIIFPKYRAFWEEAQALAFTWYEATPAELDRLHAQNLAWQSDRRTYWELVDRLELCLAAAASKGEESLVQHHRHSLVELQSQIQSGAIEPDAGLAALQTLHREVEGNL